MSDKLCATPNCPKAGNCYRKKAMPSKRQSYATFPPYPACEMYWEILPPPTKRSRGLIPSSWGPTGIPEKLKRAPEEQTIQGPGAGNLDREEQ